MNDSGVRTPISVPKGLELSENDKLQANIAVYQYTMQSIVLALTPRFGIKLDHFGLLHWNHELFLKMTMESYPNQQPHIVLLGHSPYV